VVGLAGLEPAASSLSEMDGRALCYPAFALVVRLRKSYKDGVNPRPLLCRAQRLLGDDDPHEEGDHNAGAPEQGQHHEQHSDQRRVGVEISGEAATHAGPSLRLVRLRYSLRVWAMAPPLARMPTLARVPVGQAGGLRSRLHRSMQPQLSGGGWGGRPSRWRVDGTAAWRSACGGCHRDT